MKLNHIYKGDCVGVLSKNIDKESVNLIFADPPYNLSGNGLKWKGNKTGGDWYMINEDWYKSYINIMSYNFNMTSIGNIAYVCLNILDDEVKSNACNILDNWRKS